MAQFFNDYLNVKTPRQLYDYLEQKLGEQYTIDFDEVEGNQLYFFVDNIPFEVCFTRGKRMSVCCDMDFEDELQDVLNVLSPIMWYRSPKSDPKASIGPFISYVSEDGMRVYEWDYVNPKARLAELVRQQARGETKFFDVKLLHSEFEDNPFESQIKYGVFTGFLDQNLVDTLPKCHEIELFITLQFLFDKYDDLVYCAERLDVDASDKLDAVNYNIAYVAQLTKRFGVPMHEPTAEFEINCPEFYAWFEWWKASLPSLIEKHPELKDKLWTDDELLNIRPDGSYEEYLPLIKERFKELEKEQSKPKRNSDFDEIKYAYRDPSQDKAEENDSSQSKKN